MLISDAELLRRGILLIEHIADLCQPIQSGLERGDIEEMFPDLISRSRDRLERIINAANSIED
jgi:hypothetical protein